MTSFYIPETYGNDPINTQWKVVRGDTASLKIEFFENDEKTYFDTSDWEYAATTYDFRGDVLDELEVIVSDDYIEIKASPEITSLWGEGYSSVVGELAFDLQITIDNDIIWTPIVGTIKVYADVTGGSL
jgi:hypothetical protein